MTTESQLHVVFGAGQVGPLLARSLAGRGHRVRVVRRSEPAPIAGVEVVRGDALDEAVCREVTRGAACVYDCLNPAYSTRLWAAQLPRIADNLVSAAGRSDARLVVLDNLYMLGAPRGRTLDEDTAVQPSSRKGEIRARVSERFLAAHARGEARVVLGRASDFYGPGATGSQFEAHFWTRLLRGKTVQLLMNPDTPHTYHYLDDVAAALATLGAAPDDALGAAWMLPCAPAPTTRELVGKLASAVGRGEVRVQRVPRMLVKGVALAWPLMRELDEMLYQWDEPFVVDDSRFRARFGASPTPLDEGAQRMAAWAKFHYGGGGKTSRT